MFGTFLCVNSQSVSGGLAYLKYEMRLLRVNMDKLSISLELLPKKWEIMGGRGLTARILSQEVPPEVDPLGSSAKLVFACGPLAGTNAPSCGRLSIGAKSPLTLGIKESNSGGPIGQKMDRLGIRAIVVEGSCASGKLYLLNINGRKVSLQPADQFKGLKNYDLVNKLREKGSKTSIISVGIAGERGYKSAAIAMTDMRGKPTRHAARGGLGSVMAAKGLKAILFNDDDVGAAKTKNKMLFQSIVRKWNKEMGKDLAIRSMAKYGTLGIVESLNQLGGIPCNNYHSNVLTGMEKVSGTHIKEVNEKRGGRMEACMAGCIVKCSIVYRDKKKRTVTSNLQYQTIALMGTNLGLTDPDVVAKMDYLADDLGIDTIEVGAAMGIAAEVGRMELGSTQSAFALIDEIDKGSKLGRVLANGVVETCHYFGIKRIPAFKGQALPAHDGRVSKAIGVTYSTSPMGADHTAGYTYEKFSQKEGALERSMDAQINAVVQDNLGYCQLATPTDPSRVISFLSQLINARYNLKTTAEDLLEAGKETLRIELDYNRRCDFSSTHAHSPEFIREESIGQQKLVFDVEEEKLATFWNELNKGNAVRRSAYSS